jgi:GTP-binding protein EngB required for normal cell division
MVAKLDEQGDAQKLKRARAGNQKPYPEERKIMETFQEHYISEKEEIKNVISLFAINAESFPYDQFLEKAIKQPEKPKLILQP